MSSCPNGAYLWKGLIIRMGIGLDYCSRVQIETWWIICCILVFKHPILRQCTNVADEWHTLMKEIVDYIVDEAVSTKQVCMGPKAYKIKSSKYCMFGGYLYMSSFSGPLLKYLGPKVALKVMAEMHEDFCINHTGGHSMAQRIMLQGFIG